MRPLTLVLLAVLLSGCALTPPIPDASDTPSVDTTAIITLGAQADMEPQLAPILRTFADSYPDASIQFVPTSSSVVTAQTAAPLAQSADVIIATIADRTAAAAVFTDLAPLRDADATAAASTFWPGTADACQGPGRLLGLPLTLEPTLIMADVAAFADANLPLPAPDWTWDEFIQLAQALHQSGNTPRYGFVPFSGPPLAAPTGTPDTTLLARYDTYIQLARDAILPPTTADQDDLVQHGRAALWTDTLLNLPVRQSARPAGVIALPFPGGPTPVTVTCALISAGTQSPDAAWALVRALSAAGPRAGWWETPAQQDAARQTGVDPTVQPTLDTALAQLAVADPATIALVDAALSDAAASGRSMANLLATMSAAPPPPPSPPSVMVASPVPTARADVQTIRFLGLALPTDAATTVYQQVARTAPAYRVQSVDSAAVSRTVGGVQLFDPDRFPEQADCFIGAGFARAQVLDMQPLLDTDATGWRDDLPPALLATLRAEYGGTLTAMPLTQDNLVIYYNRAVLTAQGIAPPDANWTAEMLLAAIEQASRPGDMPVYGFAAHGQRLMPFLLALHGIDAATTPLSDPVIQEQVAWVQSAVARGVLVPDGVTTPRGEAAYTQQTALIAAGQVAFWLGTVAGTVGDVQDGQGRVQSSALDRGMVAPPASSVGYPAFAQLFSIAPTVSDPNGCWALGAALSQSLPTMSAVPMRRSVQESEAFTRWRGAEAAETARLAFARAQGRLGPHAAEELLDSSLPALLSTNALEPALAALEPRVGTLARCRADAATVAARSACFNAALGE